MAKRYQPHELLGEQGGVQTFAGRDAVNGLPVRLYSFMGEPTSREGELRSDFIPPVLSTTFTGTAGEVVSAFSGEFRRLKGAVEPKQVEALLRETAAALDDAARAGVIHGDLSPERVFFDREAGASGRFVLEGYGVPWPVRPSEFSAPERIGGASFSGDIFSWARTIKHLSGPLPGDLRDLLDRCLSADPKERPHAREVCAALERYPFGNAAPRPNRQAHRDTSAFEQYADYSTDDRGGYADDAAEGMGAQADNLSELTLPPKTIKLEEYRRQQARVLSTRETSPQAAPQPEATSQEPTSSPPVSPLPTPVNTQSGSAKAPPPKNRSNSSTPPQLTGHVWLPTRLSTATRSRHPKRQLPRQPLKPLPLIQHLKQLKCLRRQLQSPTLHRPHHLPYRQPRLQLGFPPYA